MSKGSIKYKVECKVEKLKAKCFALAKQINMDRDEMINVGAGFFLQSVIKETPPNKCAKDAATYTTRIMRPAKGKDRFKVTVYGKHQKTHYGSMADMAKYKEIWYRGMGKMGWFNCLKFLKKPPRIGKFKTGDKVALKESVSRSVERKYSSGSDILIIAMTNKVENIGRYGQYVANWALQKAYNRIYAWGKSELKKRTKQKWQAA